MAQQPPQRKRNTSLRDSIIDLQCKKISDNSVVSLTEYRLTRKLNSDRTILVVDRDKMSRGGVKRHLEAESFRVEVAEDAISLSQALEMNRLDLILLDVDLPWVDGYELCSLLKSHDAVKRIPVVMTSESSTTELVDMCFAAGCDEFLVKPFDADRMADVLNKVFS